MKKKMRGFTIIECLIALLVLAVSSLLLTQAYSQLVRVSIIATNRNNNVHLQSSVAADPAKYAGSASGAVNTIKTNAELTVKSKFPSGSTGSSKTYTMKADSYSVKPYDKDDTQMSAGNVGDGTDTCFVVITPPAGP